MNGRIRTAASTSELRLLEQDCIVGIVDEGLEELEEERNWHRGPLCRPPKARAHRLVKLLYCQMKIEKMTRVELIRRSGVPSGTLLGWWKGKTTPRIDLLDACFGVFDLELKARAREKRE
jgi:hypothetical protein